MNTVPQIFNYNKILLHRNRAAKNINENSFLINEAANRLLERLEDLADSFSKVLSIGHSNDYLANAINDKFLCDILINQDLSNKMLNSSKGVVASYEKLPFKDKSFDLVISNLILHFVNDLPGTLLQIQKLLKKDGAFLACIYGGQTLYELRSVMADVETEEYGSVSPRIAPFIDIKTLGSLVQRAGFIQPVIDSDIIKVSYDNIIDLMQDIRNMAESSPLIKNGRPLNKNMVAKISDKYSKIFSDGDGGIIATFEIVNITSFA